MYMLTSVILLSYTMQLTVASNCSFVSKYSSVDLSLRYDSYTMFVIIIVALYVLQAKSESQKKSHI